MRGWVLLAFLVACVGNAPEVPTASPDGAHVTAPAAPGPAQAPEPAPAPEPAQAPEPAPAPAAPRPAAPPVPVLASTPPEIYRCETDADCVIECDLPGNCCGAPCGCRTAVNRHVLAELKTQPWLQCTKEMRKRCPAVACGYDPAFGSTCREGRCVATDGPLDGFR